MGMRRIHVRWLLVVPIVAAVGTPLYARATPRLASLPFVVWFQFATVVLGIVVAGTVYLVEGRHDQPEADGPAPGAGTTLAPAADDAV